MPWHSIAGAVLCHLLLIVVASRLVSARLPPLTKEELVRVEIVMQAPPPAQAPEAASLPAPAVPQSPAPQVDAEGLTQASRTYAAKVLDDRRNRAARLALPLLAADERLIQLCNIEAMEQVRLAGSALVPEAVVAYAMAEMEMGRYTLFAHGAAFRSGRHWYNIAYKCTVQPDYRGVVSFAFRIGDEIPPAEWESHNLALDAGHVD